MIFSRQLLDNSTFMFIFAEKFSMKKNVLIELLESGDKVSLYSPRFEGEEFTEFERFLLTYKDNGTNINGPLEITIYIDDIEEE